MGNLSALVLHDAEHGVLQLDGVQTFLPLGHRGVDVHAIDPEIVRILPLRCLKMCANTKTFPNSPSILGPQPHGGQNAAHFLGFFSHQIGILCTEV